MLALEILDIKDFTTKLFVGNVFDAFYLSEASFTTFLSCTFQLSRKNTEKMLLSSGLSLSPEDVFGLFLNCQFDRGRLVCTTGTSLRIFTIDRTVDQLWDDMIRRFFRQQGISFTEE